MTTSLYNVKQVLFQAAPGSALVQVLDWTVSVDPLLWWAVVVVDRDTGSNILSWGPWYSFGPVTVSDYLFNPNLGGTTTYMPDRILNLRLIFQAGGNPATGLLNASTFDFTISPGSGGGGGPSGGGAGPTQTLAIALLGVAGLSVLGTVLLRRHRRRNARFK